MRRAAGILAMLVLTVFPGAVRADVVETAGVIHVHSDWSSGVHPVSRLAARCRDLGLSFMILSDHDLVRVEYGVRPFEKWIKRAEERKSVIKDGAEAWIAAVDAAGREVPGVTVVPGVQASPFYWWSGRPWSGLTVHDLRKEILVAGMDRPGDYEDLPRLHGRLSTCFFGRLWPRSLMFAGVLVLGIVLFRQGGRRARLAGGAAAVLGLVFLVHDHPFPSLPWDAYHGPQGESPFQAFLDAAAKRGALTFWAHPESIYDQGRRDAGPVTLDTEPYPDALWKTTGYTGFAAVYGDTAHAHEPGREWDQALMQVVTGTRTRPPWAIAEADYHGNRANESLDGFQTVIPGRVAGRAELLRALSDGRMYAVRKTGAWRLRLDGFSVSGDGGSAGMGETLATGGGVTVSGEVTATDRGAYPVEVTVVKNGWARMKEKGTTPFSFSLSDPPALGRAYYRVLVQGPGGNRIVGNPVFVEGRDP